MRGSISPSQEFLLRLIAELERTPPERFDYNCTKEPCGCVMPAAARIGYDRLGDDWPVSSDDSGLLIGMSPWTTLAGKRGLTEAIRRCRVVLARVTPPSTQKER